MKLFSQSRLSFVLLALALASIALGFLFQKTHFFAYADHPHSTTSDYKIVATTTLIADMASRLLDGAEDVEIQSLIGSGVDPHLYRPTRSDMIRLQQADMILWNGLNLEGQMADVLKTMSSQKPSLSLASAIQLQGKILQQGDALDPHIWMDCQLWQKALLGVSGLLQAELPQYKDLIETNALSFSKELEELHEYIKQTIQTIPERQRLLVTAHDAFGYFGEAYDIQVIGIQGLSTESEAGLKRIQDIIEILVENDIPAVFAETSVSPRNIKALVEGAAAKGHTVRMGSPLFSDSLGPENTETATYIGMMRHNVHAIVHFLSKDFSSPNESPIDVPVQSPDK